MLTFFLGTHQADWLRRALFPLFINRARLARLKRLKPATVDWALDSRGFTELSAHGRWTIKAKQYVDEVRRFRAEVGRMLWAAPMDWMCEERVVAKTGLSVRKHQQRTLANYLELLSLGPELPFVPVLQGFVLDDYLRHVKDYARAGIELRRQRLVGVGTLCRRQATKEAEELLRVLHHMGLKLHAFGFKLKGLARVADVLVSADSLAWSKHARHRAPLPGCKHAKCTSCLLYASRWRQRVVELLEREAGKPHQGLLL